jgi:hypothetical protein
MDCPYLGMTGITSGEVPAIQSTYGNTIFGFGASFANGLSQNANFPYISDMDYNY